MVQRRQGGGAFYDQLSLIRGNDKANTKQTGMRPIPGFLPLAHAIRHRNILFGRALRTPSAYHSGVLRALTIMIDRLDKYIRRESLVDKHVLYYQVGSIQAPV